MELGGLRAMRHSSWLEGWVVEAAMQERAYVVRIRDEQSMVNARRKPTAQKRHKDSTVRRPRSLPVWVCASVWTSSAP